MAITQNPVNFLKDIDGYWDVSVGEVFLKDNFNFICNRLQSESEISSLIDNNLFIQHDVIGIIIH